MNYTKEQFQQLLNDRSDITTDDNPFLIKKNKMVEIQPELPLSGDELFHRLFDHREKELLETTVQSKYIEWIRLNKLYVEVLRSCFAIPNGGFRAKKTAKTMKAEGAEPGVPDIMILAPAKGYAGLVIETKTKYNQPTEDQIEWLNRLSRNNFYCVVCWSELDMINVTCWFFDLPNTVRYRYP